MEKIIFPLLMLLPIVEGGTTPGSFFWKPRVGLDLQVPTNEDVISKTISQPTKQNIQEGLVVVLRGYQAGMSVICLAAGLSSGYAMDPHLNPLSAFFYNDAYRWFLRYVNLVPFWFGNTKLNFCDTTKVWHRRFYYMDAMVPKWMRYLFPVKQESWKHEEVNNKHFNKYALSSFGKYFENPSKVFRDFKTFETEETAEPSFEFSDSI